MRCPSSPFHATHSNLFSSLSWSSPPVTKQTWWGLMYSASMVGNNTSTSELHDFTHSFYGNNQTRLKGPSHQIRSVWRWSGRIVLDYIEYMMMDLITFVKSLFKCNGLWKSLCNPDYMLNNPLFLERQLVLTLAVSNFHLLVSSRIERIQNGWRWGDHMLLLIIRNAPGTVSVKTNFLN